MSARRTVTVSITSRDALLRDTLATGRYRGDEATAVSGVRTPGASREAVRG